MWLALIASNANVNHSHLKTQALPCICYRWHIVKTAYTTDSNILAHLALHQLQQAGIKAEIRGEFLQGGVGELPAAGNLRIYVAASDVDEAKQVIADWEAMAAD